LQGCSTPIGGRKKTTTEKPNHCPLLQDKSGIQKPEEQIFPLGLGLSLMLLGNSASSIASAKRESEGCGAADEQQLQVLLLWSCSQKCSEVKIQRTSP